MKIPLSVLLLLFLAITLTSAQNKTETKEETVSNLRQSYSAKFGFYQPGDGLNNGLILGVDGITEFIHYNFFLSGTIDLYPKQSIDIFQSPKPDIQQQQIILLPLHINIGYKIFDATDADSRGYFGVGAGYYFYFYNVDYTSGGGLLGSVTPQSAKRNDGNFIATAFARVLIGKVFLEPRFYFATKSEDNVGSYKFVVNPSGFAITIGFQQ